MLNFVSFKLLKFFVIVWFMEVRSKVKVMVVDLVYINKKIDRFVGM